MKNNITFLNDEGVYQNDKLEEIDFQGKPEQSYEASASICCLAAAGLIVVIIICLIIYS